MSHYTIERKPYGVDCTIWNKESGQVLKIDQSDYYQTGIRQALLTDRIGLSVICKAVKALLKISAQETSYRFEYSSKQTIKTNLENFIQDKRDFYSTAFFGSIREALSERFGAIAAAKQIIKSELSDVRY